MKKIILLSILFFIAIIAKSQTSTVRDSVNLDLLNAPSNPAFNLMGISTSAIDRPTDLNAFKLSIQNATNNFTKFPNSYAVEVSPAALSNIKGQTLDNFNKAKNYGDLWWQTLSVSIGVTRSNAEDKETDDSTSYNKLGFGLKFSFIRPRWTDSTQFYYMKFDSLQNKLLKEYLTITIKAKNSSLLVQQLQKDLVRANALPSSRERDEKIQELIKQLGEVNQKIQDIVLDSMNKSIINELKESAKKFKIERKGIFLDFASGLVVDFPDNSFNYSLVSKVGAWLTGGYEGGNNFSALGIARYLFQPDKIFADDNGTLKSKGISTFDFGGRVALSGLQGKFCFSSEGIYRSVLTKNTTPSSWRLVFNTEYNVGFNQKITLSIGKNFDGTIIKGGNLIAALNFVKGFGTNKSVASKK